VIKYGWLKFGVWEGGNIVYNGLYICFCPGPPPPQLLQKLSINYGRDGNMPHVRCDGGYSVSMLDLSYINGLENLCDRKQGILYFYFNDGAQSGYRLR
jgi:hypothetical protein